MKSAAWWPPRAASASASAADPDGVVEPALVLGQGGPRHLPAPRRQRVVPPVGVLLQSGDGVVERRPLPDLEVVIDTPAKRPSEVILEVCVAAETFDAVGDLQTTGGVQRAGRDHVHRMQRFDQGAYITRLLGSAQVLLGLGRPPWAPGRDPTKA